MGSQADRAAEERSAKLAEIQRQVKSGALKIRKMTAKERKSFPPPAPRQAKGRGR